METTGQRIRRLRLDRGMKTQGDLCALVPEIGQSTMSAIESKNQGFSGKALLELSRALKVSPEYIIYGGVEEDMGTAEIAQLFAMLSPQEREMLLIAARGLAGNMTKIRAA